MGGFAARDACSPARPRRVSFLCDPRLLLELIVDADEQPGYRRARDDLRKLAAVEARERVPRVWLSPHIKSSPDRKRVGFVFVVKAYNNRNWYIYYILLWVVCMYCTTSVTDLASSSPMRVSA